MTKINKLKERILLFASFLTLTAPTSVWAADTATEGEGETRYWLVALMVLFGLLTFIPYIAMKIVPQEKWMQLLSKKNKK